MRQFKNIFLLTFGVLLLMAPNALADTIRYDIPPGPNYTVDNEQGIAKVTFNACLVSGQPTTLSFTTVTQSTKSVTAEYKVLKEGAEVSTVFDPATVALAPGDQSFQTTLTLTPQESTGKPILLRAKLDTANGEGVGQGPGIMVRIECVGTPAQPAGPGTTPFVVNDEGGAQLVTPVPFVAPAQAVGQGQSRCVGVKRVVLRANQTTRVVVTVNRDGQNVRRAMVRVLGVGVNMKRMTNANGVVVFNVKPKKAGKLYVQSNACIGADQLTVRRALAATTTGTGGADFTG